MNISFFGLSCTIHGNYERYETVIVDNKRIQIRYRAVGRIFSDKILSFCIILIAIENYDYNLTRDR